MASFHSPLNSNAILTISIDESRVDAASDSNVFKFNSDPIINAHLQKFELMPSRPNQYRLKFIDKDLAIDLQEKLESAYSFISTDLSYDQLTHPGNIYVRGLTQELDNQDLFELFKPFGEISSCKIVLDQFGQSKGYGFVNFTNGQAAQDAIEKLNGLLINGSKLYLNHHISKKERIERLDFERLNFTNLYIKNLPVEFEEEDIRKLFGKFGEIDSVFLPDVSTVEQQDQDKRFGFINYKNHESAVEAILNLDSKELKKGLFVSVSRAQRRDERKSSLPQLPVQLLLPNPQLQDTSPPPLQASPPPLLSPQQIQLQPPNIPPFFPIPGPNQQQSNLYVKNLANSVTDEVLYNAFAKFGQIISAKIMTLEDGVTPRGFGFVCFKTIQEASNAMLQMNGSELDNEILTVSFAQRNNKRFNNKSQTVGRGTGGAYPKLNQPNGNYQLFNSNTPPQFLKSPPPLSSSASSGVSTPGSIGHTPVSNGSISNGIQGYYYPNVPLPIVPQNEYYYNGGHQYANRYRANVNGGRQNNYHSQQNGRSSYTNGHANGNGQAHTEAHQSNEVDEVEEHRVENDEKDLYVKLSSDISKLEADDIKLSKIFDELILPNLKLQKKDIPVEDSKATLQKKINDDYEGNHLDFINDLSNDERLLDVIIKEIAL